MRVESSGCCSVVDVAGAESVQRSRMGTFALAGDANGHGYYRNGAGQYLYFWPDYSTWLIGPNHSDPRAGVHSGNGPACPESASDWESYHDSDWQSSPGITVACPSELTQSQACNEQGCPVDCDGSWGGWTECSAECGGGSQSQSYTVSRQPANGGQACPSELTLTGKPSQ